MSTMQMNSRSEALAPTSRKDALPFFPQFDQDASTADVFSTPSSRKVGSRKAVCAPLKRRLVAPEESSQAKACLLAPDTKPKMMLQLSTPTSLATMISPLHRKADMPPPIPDLSDLQSKDDFTKHSLAMPGYDQNGQSSYICRPTLLPRAEVKRNKRRKSETDRRALILETCSLIEENRLTDINGKVADCHIDFPSMTSDAISLKQRCRSLQPRKSSTF